MSIEERTRILMEGKIEEDEYTGIITEYSGLKSMALRNNPDNKAEVELILSIVAEAIKDKDYDFITSYQYYRRMHMIGLDASTVRRIIFKIWSSDD